MSNQRKLIEGQPALVVIDIQAGCFAEIADKDRSIPHMPDYAERMRLARKAIDQARACDIPVIFIQEVHRPNLIDFGRELDGSETVHCLEDNPNTAIAAEEMDFRADDYLIRKRRYSAFFGTDLEILLRGLKVDTLLLCGGLTDVCRVIEDCVAGSSQAAHEASLNAMEYLQSGARRKLEPVLEAMSSHHSSSATAA